MEINTKVFRPRFPAAERHKQLPVQPRVWLRLAALCLCVFVSISSAQVHDLNEALALMNSGRVLEAIRSLKEIVRDDPKSGAAYFYLSTLYTELGEYDAAGRYLLRAIETGANKGACYNQLGMIEYRQKRWRPALGFFEQALKAGVGKDEAMVWRNIGNVQVELFEREKALAAYQRALSIQPKDARTRLALGQFYLERNEPETALPELRAAVEIEPSLAGAFAGLGRAYRRLGDRQSSVAVLRKALELNPSDQESRYSLGQVLLALGRRDEGRKELEIYQQVQDRVSRANSNFTAATARLEAGDSAQAEKLLEESVMLAPSYGLGLQTFGTVLLERGNPEKAIEFLKRALAVNPLNSTSYFSLGAAYLRLGRLAEALEATKWAVVLNDEDERYRRQLEEIERKLGQ